MTEPTRVPAPQWGQGHVPHHHPNYGLPLFLIYRELRLARGGSDPLDDLSELLGWIGRLVLAVLAIAGIWAGLHALCALELTNAVIYTGWGVVAAGWLAATFEMRNLGKRILCLAAALLLFGAAVADDVPVDDASESLSAADDFAPPATPFASLNDASQGTAGFIYGEPPAAVAQPPARPAEKPDAAFPPSAAVVPIKGSGMPRDVTVQQPRFSQTPYGTLTVEGLVQNGQSCLNDLGIKVQVVGADGSVLGSAGNAVSLVSGASSELVWEFSGVASTTSIRKSAADLRFTTEAANGPC